MFKFICHRGCFSEDISENNILCKKGNNGMNVINECIELKELEIN